MGQGLPLVTLMNRRVLIDCGDALVWAAGRHRPHQIDVHLRQGLQGLRLCRDAHRLAHGPLRLRRGEGLVPMKRVQKLAHRIGQGQRMA